MGQVANCEQCTMSSMQSQLVQQTKPIHAPPIPHRINIMSKNRNSIQLFGKKYSTQSTQSTRENVVLMEEGSRVGRDSCVVELQREWDGEVVSWEVEKCRKFLVGTSVNCHFRVDHDQNPQLNFRAQIRYQDNGVFLKDMGIGMGCFLQISTCQLVHQDTPLKQMFLIDSHFLNVSLNKSQNPTQAYEVCIENMVDGNIQTFQFTSLDLLLKIQTRRVFEVGENVGVGFEVRRNSQHKIQLEFSHENCWKYLKNHMLIEQGQLLMLGSLVYRLKRLIRNLQLESQCSIKAVD